MKLNIQLFAGEQDPAKFGTLIDEVALEEYHSKMKTYVSNKIPTNVSQLNNDAGYITSYTETDPIFSNSVASSITSSDISNWNNKSDFSGDYGDLTNKPTIKESTYSSSQYNLGYYSDTASVISDINKTMYLTPNEYGIEIKGDYTSNLPSDLVTLLGTGASGIRSAILKTYATNIDFRNTMLGGVIQELFIPDITDKVWYRRVHTVSSTTTFESWKERATTSDITAYHDSSKQDTLVSGTNIKTINGSTLLGSGNITIGGGGTATDVKINGTSITSGGEADILTNGTYSSNNKIATMSDIPTVNDGKLTIGRNGVKINDFYANSSSDVNIDISVPIEDVQVNGTSVVNNGNANLVTNSSYNASSNKIATMNDVIQDSGWINLTPSKGTWSYLRYRIIGKMVYVEGYATSLAWSGTSGDRFVSVANGIPDGYRPDFNGYFYSFIGGSRIARMGVATDGSLFIDWTRALADGSNYTSATWCMFRVTYMID